MRASLARVRPKWLNLEAGLGSPRRLHHEHEPCLGESCHTLTLIRVRAVALTQLGISQPRASSDIYVALAVLLWSSTTAARVTTEYREKPFLKR